MARGMVPPARAGRQPQHGGERPAARAGEAALAPDQPLLAPQDHLRHVGPRQGPSRAPPEPLTTL